ncbi:MAG: GNAT family N-acetyltransferase, partial [Chloroflexota bacterium]
MHMPTLTTDRLAIRPLRLDDLDAVHRLLDVELADTDMGTQGAGIRADRERLLLWSTLNYQALETLYQPPYGDRAIELIETGGLIGVCGFVPCLAPFGQLPILAGDATGNGDRLYSTEFGLYWAVAPARQRRGYAAEAAGALIGYAFHELKLHRVVATTTHDNDASLGVMRKVGMRIDRNPYPDPPWFQAVGVLDHP